jgi:hypothetical protein
MSTTTETGLSYQVRAIAPEVLSELRRRDDAGREPRILTDCEGSPLRCCLRPIQPGERAALVSYAPLRRWASADAAADPGPYDEMGPVFIHPEPCAGPEGTGFPAWLAGSHRVLRMYSPAGHIAGGQLVEPDQADPVAGMEKALDEVLGRPDVAFVHVRAVEYGCWLFEARRP